MHEFLIKKPRPVLGFLLIQLGFIALHHLPKPDTSLA